MSGNMVPGGWRLVLPLLAFGKVALDGLGEVKEHRERMKADEKRKSECEELERKLRTKEDQLIASEARNKTLEDEVRKRRAEEFRPLWRRVWQGFLVKPKDGQLRDALASLLPGNPVSVIVPFFLSLNFSPPSEPQARVSTIQSHGHYRG
ncbi:MAG: hypothetical protein Q9223_002747 [Gallowayella weberi]